MKGSSKLHYFPLIAGLMLPGSFATTFVIALAQDHILPFFSYISDTGTNAPESCIFAILLNISALFQLSVVYIRFKQVDEYLRTNGSEDKRGKTVNKVSAVLGILSALGIAIVGCFQETNVISMHVIGAFGCFLVGGLYLCTQAYFTFQMLPLFMSRVWAWIRTFLGVMCVILFIICYTCGTISVLRFHGENAQKWKPADGAWALHVTSIVTEWIMAALFDIYILSFIPEFKKISFTSPKFNVIEKAPLSSHNKGGSDKSVMHSRVSQQPPDNDNDSSV